MDTKVTTFLTFPQFRKTYHPCVTKIKVFSEDRIHASGQAVKQYPVTCERITVAILTKMYAETKFAHTSCFVH